MNDVCCGRKKKWSKLYLITVFRYDHCPPFWCVMHAGLSGINQLKIAALFRASSLVTKKSNETREFASAFCYYHTRITHPRSRTGRCFSDAVNFFFLVNVEKELTMNQFSSGKKSNPSKIIRVGCINELLWPGVVFFWVTLQKSRNQNKARRRLNFAVFHFFQSLTPLQESKYLNPQNDDKFWSSGHFTRPNIQNFKRYVRLDRGKARRAYSNST